MRRFRFQLAGLERLLAHREEAAKLRAARAAVERRRATELADHLQRRLEAAHGERRRRRAAGRMIPRDESLYEQYTGRLARALADQRRAAAQAADRHAQCLTQVRHAGTERRAVGLLHERRRADHRRRAERARTRFLDEVGSRVTQEPS
ncbi:MAG: hypothetical protein ACODAJ_06455 [Planctomycetota bacterium]